MASLAALVGAAIRTKGAVVLAAFAADAGNVLAVPADRLTSLTADAGHVLTVLADRLAALAPGLARFVRCELVRRAFLVCRMPPLAGDLALPVGLHRGEASFVFSCHRRFSLRV